MLDLAGNDTDADDGLNLASIVIVTAPSHGTVTVNANGTVEYTHDGSESTADGFTYTIEDVSGAVSNVAGVTLTVTAVNDAPALVNNALTLEEGETVTLDAADLSATDAEATTGVQSGALIFTVSVVSGGQFEEVGAPGTAITSFTQQQLTDSEIRFVHDGGEAAPAYEVSVSDGLLNTTPAGASVTFTNVDDAPELVTNALTLAEGETVTLDGTNLSATDIDTADNTLVFTVSGISGGQFEEVSGAGTPITSFTQQQLTDSEIRFVHDGGEAAPAYEVSVSDGGLSSASAGASITFTNVDDAPALVTNALTLAEGETVTLVAADLSATDAETADSALIFTVSNLSGGRFEEASAAGTPITSFTQQQLLDSEIRFVHDGGEAAPAYEVSVSDGVLNTAAAGASVTFTNVNDAPALVTNALTLAEGETVTLDAADLSATDAEATTGTEIGALVFTVSAVSGGQFEEASAAGTPITSFTQQQVSDGQIRFVHDGGEAAPAYSVSVSDGVLSDGPAGASVTFANVNDAPVAVADAGTLAEGGTLVLDLAGNDTDADDGLNLASIVIVTAPSHGTVTVNANGTVEYTHDGSESTADGFTYTIEDASGAVSNVAGVTLTVTAVNDAPALVNNALTLEEGETVTLDAADLSATDAEAADSALIFTVSSVSGGQFEEAGAPGTPITSFTQQQLTDSEIRFVHDGGEAAPAYEVSVSDGVLNTAAAGASVTFTNVNDTPELVTNALTLEEGETVTLDAADLSATDAEAADSALIFTVSAVSGGQFEEASGSGTPITSFTQQQVINGQIRFVHDGGEAAPAYEVSVSDGVLSTAAAAGASVTFTNVNDAPELVNNALTLSEGETVTLDDTNLSATDIDTADSTLVFTVSAISGGQFEEASGSGTPITSFTQQQLTDGQIRFVHDGGEAAPAYEVSVSDGLLSDGPTAASVTFTNVNDAPALVNNVLTLAEGGTVTLDAADLSATDVDTAASTLIFTVSTVSGGQFEEASAARVRRSRASPNSS